MCNLKELTARMVEKVGSRHDVAKLLGVSETDLSYWCNPDHPRFIPLDHFVDLNVAAQDIGLKELARDRGFNMTKREKPLQTGSIFQIIGRFSAACGHLAFVVLQAAADRVFSRNEQRQINHAMRPVKDCVDEIEHAIAH